MTFSSLPSVSPALRIILFCFTFILGIESGAASFVMVVVLPVWASSAEAARGWLPDMPYILEEGDFFMYASTSTMLLSIITLIASWRAPAHIRKWILIPSIGFICIFVWSMLYFVPIQDTTLKGNASAALSDTELESKLNMFINLNYIRVLSLWIFFACALHAFGFGYRRSG